MWLDGLGGRWKEVVVHLEEVWRGGAWCAWRRWWLWRGALGGGGECGGFRGACLEEVGLWRVPRRHGPDGYGVVRVMSMRMRRIHIVSGKTEKWWLGSMGFPHPGLRLEQFPEIRPSERRKKSGAVDADLEERLKGPFTGVREAVKFCCTAVSSRPNTTRSSPAPCSTTKSWEMSMVW